MILSLSLELIFLFQIVLLKIFIAKITVKYQ